MHISYHDEKENLHVHFLYSPYHEMIGSLHVLGNPKHHLSREEWANNMLGRLTPSMRDRVEQYNHSLNNYIALCSFIRNRKRWDMSISECLSAIEAMPNETFMLHLYYGNGLSKEALLNALRYDCYDQCIPSAYLENLKNAEVFQQELIAFLRDYYTHYFVNDIRFAEPLLIRKLKREHERCSSMSIYDYMNELHPRIEITENKVNFHKYKLFEAYRDDVKEVVLTIDSYHIPHLLMGLHEEASEIKLIIPAYITSYDKHKLPEDTLGILKGVADATRMKIIKYLYSRPMSTQNIADRLNLTEACISKHLKILYKAGIVSKERDGNYMQYHLNINVIDSLVLHIYEYIN